MESPKENIPTQLSLKWNGFTDNIITSLEYSLGNQDFVDVTLVCEGGSIKAHRLVLSSCSYFFQRVFKENVCPHPVIVLKGITFSELETLLMFIYHGEARTYEENIPRLLEAAQFLEIRGLTSECSQVASDPKVSKDSEEKTDEISNNFRHSGVHSTTQESSDFFPHVEVSKHYVSRTACQGGNEYESQQIGNERTDISNILIKQEPLEEVDMKDFGEVSGQTVEPSPTTPKTMLGDKVNFCLPNTKFTIQELMELQEQKKLAFYEPRPCPKCHRVYRDAASLRNHLISMHETLRHKAACSCGSLFSTKHELYTHRKRDHKGVV